MAEKGYDLLLIARRENRLQEISLSLQEKYNVKVNYFVADLKDKNTPQKIYDHAKSLNLDIEILMLNAGYQINTKLEDASLEDEEDCLRVLGISVIMLTKLFLSDLKKEMEDMSWLCLQWQHLHLHLGNLQFYMGQLKLL